MLSSVLAAAPLSTGVVAGRRRRRYPPDEYDFYDDWEDGDYADPAWSVFLSEGDFDANVVETEAPDGGNYALEVTETTGGGTSGVIGWDERIGGWSGEWTLTGAFRTESVPLSTPYQTHGVEVYRDLNADRTPLRARLGFLDGNGGVVPFAIDGDLVDAVEESYDPGWEENAWYNYEIRHDGDGTYTGRLWKDGDGRPSDPNARSVGDPPDGEPRSAAIHINGARRRDFRIRHSHMGWRSGGRQTGYYGRYYNLTSDHPDMEGGSEPYESGLVRDALPLRLTERGEAVYDRFDWYDEDRLVEERVDAELRYSDENFLPIDEGEDGDPFHFAAHWTATVDAPSDGAYEFVLGSDDDSWLFLNGELAIDNGGKHSYEERSAAVSLDEGENELDLFFAERKTSGSNIYVEPDAELRVFPRESEPVLGLDVASQRPVQVVFDADVNDDGTLDLVEDKATAVLVYPDGANLGELSSDVTVTTRVFDGDRIESTATETISASDYRQLAEDDDFVEMRIDVPASGSRTIRSSVIANDDQQETDDGNAVTETVSVTSTEGIDLAYWRVTDVPHIAEFGEPTQSEYEDHIDHSDTFVQATFPVAKSDYNSDLKGDYVGDPYGGQEGMWDDLASLDYWAWQTTDGARGVGVTNEGYWDFHDISDWRGVTNPSLNSFLVAEGYWVTTAHELGHQLGLHTDNEEYDLSGLDRGDGYWVERSELVQDRVAFMEGYVEESYDRWVSNVSDDADDFEDYDHLFDQKLEGEISTTTTVAANEESDIIYLTGTVTADGALDAATTHFHQSGRLKDGTNGAFAVVGRDAAGESVVERSFDVSFVLLADGIPESPVETEKAPFSFPMAYPSELRTLEFQYEGHPIERLMATVTILHDAIDSVPDDAFRDPGRGNGRNDDNRRETLHNKVDAIERQLDAENEQGARRKLENDLRPAVDGWLNSDHPATPGETSKEELLVLIRNQIERLE